MELVLNVTLVVAATLCGLVAGFVFSFAVVVMPGISKLSDRGFLRAFKVMDGVIQNNQPLFMIVWLGSALAVIAAAILAFFELEGMDFWLTTGACGLYILAVQLPTVAFNIPLNNRLQSLSLEEMSELELTRERNEFESSWVRWNSFRTVGAVISTSILLFALLRIDG